MDIAYNNKTVKQQCTDLKRAKKDFSNKVARKLMQKINFIESAENLESVINYLPMHFHALQGDLKGLYAMDVDGRRSAYRLIARFEDANPQQVFEQAVAIEVIQIMEVSKHYE